MKILTDRKAIQEAFGCTMSNHCYCSAENWILFCCHCPATKKSIWKEPDFAPIVHIQAQEVPYVE